MNFIFYLVIFIPLFIFSTIFTHDKNMEAFFKDSLLDSKSSLEAKSMLDNLNSSNETLSLEQNLDTIISLRGEPTKRFKKSEGNALKTYLKTEKFLDTSEWTDYAQTQVKDENNLLNFSNQKVTLQELPAVENEVILYSSKEFCSAEIFYGDNARRITHYFVGFRAGCN